MRQISQTTAFFLMVAIIGICSIIDTAFPVFPAIGVAGGACYLVGRFRKDD